MSPYPSCTKHHQNQIHIVFPISFLFEHGSVFENGGYLKNGINTLKNCSNSIYYAPLVFPINKAKAAAWAGDSQLSNIPGWAGPNLAQLGLAHGFKPGCTHH